LIVEFLMRTSLSKCLIGFGGHAREVMAQMQEKLPCFVDDEYVCEDSIPLSEFNPKKYSAMIALGDSQQRKEMYDKLPSNTKYFSFIHPSAQIMDTSIFADEGAFIGANCILTTNIRIGKHVILNRGNHISHDCEIGDFFSVMPNAIVSGNVSIGNQVYLGANSSIKEKVCLSNDIKIGMGSVVTKSLNQAGVYMGVPAKKYK
jgi:sugar O-acyltransferase (sialic acid O-acetyltransferase NeuD family)